MSTSTSERSYTLEGILSSLGYADILTAASQQARMVLLGRLARYQAVVKQFEGKWHCTLQEMKNHYESINREDFEIDDDYLEWQWYIDAVKLIEGQIAFLSH